MSDDVSDGWAASAAAWIVEQGEDLQLRLFVEPQPTAGDPHRIAHHRRVPFFHIMERQKPA